MDQLDAHSALAADVLNAAWWVRHYPRRLQAAHRKQAIQKMGAVVLAALEAADDAEPVLYAVAVGLYSGDDPRFRV